MNYLEECAGIYTQYTQAAIGSHIHTPINMIFQGVDKTHVAGVFQFQAPSEVIKRLTANADLNNHHALWIGDAFFRPKIISQSQHLLGTGIGGIFRNGFDMESWVQHGKVLKSDIPA